MATSQRRKLKTTTMTPKPMTTTLYELLHNLLRLAVY
jgi:hypothetical protein